MSDDLTFGPGGCITINPGRMGGYPTVAGTRVPIDVVLNLMDDCTDEEIIEWYPLPIEAVRNLRSLLNMTTEADYRVVPHETAAGRLVTRRRERYVTDWKEDTND